MYLGLPRHMSHRDRCCNSFSAAREMRIQSLPRASTWENAENATQEPSSRHETYAEPGQSGQFLKEDPIQPHGPRSRPASSPQPPFRTYEWSC